MSFETLGLMAPIRQALETCGYQEPTPIQTQSIPPALAGRDVLGCAQTGTGKTCAFGAPILQRLTLQKSKGGHIRALILTPTRELAIQIGESLTAYGKNLPLRSTVIFGGVGQAPQEAALRRGVDILTATPGRLLDLHGQGLIDFSQVEIFVLDEADRMLDMGFIHDVRRVIKDLPQKKQTLFFSATMPQEVTELVDSLLKDPVKVAVDPVSSPVEVIRQEVCLVDRDNKTKLLAHLIREDGVKNALVFTRTKHGADKVARDLVRQHVQAAAIHGNKSQTARQQALAHFKSGEIQVLVATDIAARGLDIEELSHVFNYNLPEVPETYIHRIGRTGRAGRGGTAVSFCDFSEGPYLKGIETLVGKAIPRREHPWPIEVFQAAQRDARGRIVNADDAEARAAARAKREGAKQPARKSPAAAPPAAPAAGPKKRPRNQNKKPLEESAILPADLSAAASELEPASRPDPLKGDRIMDATARLLATKPLPGRKPAQKRPPQGKGGPANPGNRNQRRGRRPSPEEAKTPVLPAQEGKKTLEQLKAAGKDTKKPLARGASRKVSRRKIPPAPVIRSHQKDSTEQPSLMKPYYIDHD